MLNLNKRFKRIYISAIAIILTLIAPFNVSAADDLSALTNANEVYVGGFPFGIKLYTEGLLVVGVADVASEKGCVRPASDAGIKTGDVIIEVNGSKVTTCEEFISVYEKDGGTLKVEFMRNGKKSSTEIKTPA